VMGRGIRIVSSAPPGEGDTMRGRRRARAAMVRAYRIVSSAPLGEGDTIRARRVRGRGRSRSGEPYRIEGAPGEAIRYGGSVEERGLTRVALHAPGRRSLRAGWQSASPRRHGTRGRTVSSAPPGGDTIRARRRGRAAMGRASRIVSSAPPGEGDTIRARRRGRAAMGRASRTVSSAPPGEGDTIRARRVRGRGRGRSGEPYRIEGAPGEGRYDTGPDQSKSED